MLIAYSRISVRTVSGPVLMNRSADLFPAMIHCRRADSTKPFVKRVPVRTDVVASIDNFVVNTDRWLIACEETLPGSEACKLLLRLERHAGHCRHRRQRLPLLLKLVRRLVQRLVSHLVLQSLWRRQSRPSWRLIVCRQTSWLARLLEISGFWFDGLLAQCRSFRKSKVIGKSGLAIAGRGSRLDPLCPMVENRAALRLSAS